MKKEPKDFISFQFMEEDLVIIEAKEKAEERLIMQEKELAN